MKLWKKPVRHICRPSLILSAVALALTLASPTHALNLTQSYQLALQQDATYQASRAEAAANREAVPMAFAQLLPNLSGNLSRNKNDTNSAVPGFLGATVNNSYEYMSSSYALVLRQPLYRKYNFAQYQQAQSQVVSAEASLDRSLQDLLVRLSGAYFEALMAQDQLALVLAQKEAFGAQLQGAKRMFASGQGTRTDIDDAQARYDMVLAQELEASQNVGYTRRQLQVIINQPAENLALLNPARMQLVAPMPADPEDWIARGEEVNAELRAMRANIESSRQEVEKARAGHMPTVDLIAQRSRSNSANDTTIHQLYLSTSVGLQVNIPLFAGGYVNASVRQALASLDKYHQQYEAKRREIDMQIRKEFQNVAEGVFKVKALEQAERSSDQAVFSNQKGYQAGTRTQIDILNAQQQRMNVRRDLAQARYLYLMARVRLQGLVGSLSEEEINLINSWLSESGASSLAGLHPG
ncbi:MAG: TolC family outer membrane protein [Proteobacteria bacterium]|nr:TolC family outer membrane protein [Pseudomonadota bacterium]